MNQLEEKENWTKVAETHLDKTHIDPVLGRYKSDEFIRLVRSWIKTLGNKTVLKTDLREEAYGEDEVLFSLSDKDTMIVAIDITEETTKNAYIKQKENKLGHHYITSDVRNLPFRDNVFDAILSTSTLDHFNTENDFIKSLLELKRVIKPTGLMIITVNNKCNFIFYILLKLEKFLGLTSYPVNSFTPNKLKNILNSVGLNIQSKDAIVHIISPTNTILLLSRRFLNDKIIDKIARKCIYCAHCLSKVKKTKLLTGWFIALKCRKDI